MFQTGTTSPMVLAAGAVLWLLWVGWIAALLFFGLA